MEQVEPASNRLDELESLRGLAALLIVLFHMPQWYPPFHAIPLIKNGGLMVDFFFVLSGFVICRAYGGKIHAGQDMLRFQLLRLGRLYPVHLLFLLLFLVIECARWGLAEYGYLSSDVPPFGSNDLTSLLLQTFLLQALAPAQYWGTFNGPAWSISVEFYGYLLFAFTCLIAGRFRRIAFWALMLLGFASLLGLGLANSNVARFLAGFFAGCLVAEWMRSRSHGDAQLWAWGAFAFFLAVVIVLGSSDWAVVSVIVASSALIASLALSPRGSLNRMLQKPTLVWLGSLSYSIYMSHFFVIYIATQLALRLSSAPTAMVDGNRLPIPAIAIAVIWMCLVVAATLLISAAVYRYIEDPVRQWTRAKLANHFGDGVARQANRQEAEPIILPERP